MDWRDLHGNDCWPRCICKEKKNKHAIIQKKSCSRKNSSLIFFHTVDLLKKYVPVFIHVTEDQVLIFVAREPDRGSGNVKFKMHYRKWNDDDFKKTKQFFRLRDGIYTHHFVHNQKVYVTARHNKNGDVETKSTFEYDIDTTTWQVYQKEFFNDPKILGIITETFGTTKPTKKSIQFEKVVSTYQKNIQNQINQ